MAEGRRKERKEKPGTLRGTPGTFIAGRPYYPVKKKR